MNKTIRVLHVGLSSNIGGIETVVKSWFDHKPDDFTFDFINNGAGKLAFEDEFAAGGAKIYTIPPRKSDIVGSYRQLSRIVNEGGYDYLHFHAMSLSWPEPILIAAKSPHTQGIVHSHLVVGRRMDLKHKLLHEEGAIRLHFADYLRIACGEEAGKSMFGKKAFTVIPNGIALDRFQYSEIWHGKARENLGIPAASIVIGHVGRPSAQKNYPFLFRAFRKLLDDNPSKDFRLLLIGDLTDDCEIQALVLKYDLRERTTFTGRVADTSQYYSAMDCFFLPSLFEGFSVALLEAQAAGLPCVVSENVARESQLSEKFAFVNLEDEREAVEQLAEYAAQPTDRSLPPGVKAYDIEQMARTMFDYYRKHM